MTMTPEAWTAIGTGVVILIAIAASHRQLQSELRTALNQIHAEIGRLRERMAKLEGLLEGLREAITGRFRAQRRSLEPRSGSRALRTANQGLLEGLCEASTGRQVT